MKQVPIDKQAVPRLQLDVFLSHLVLQNAGLRSGNFKIRVPVQGTFPVGEFGKFIFKIGNREKVFLMGICSRIYWSTMTGTKRFSFPQRFSVGLLCDFLQYNRKPLSFPSGNPAPTKSARG